MRAAVARPAGSATRPSAPAASSRDQAIRARGLQLVPGSVAPEDAKGAHPVRMGAGDVEASVADHHAVARRQGMTRDDVDDEFGLMVQRAAGLRAMDGREERVEADMAQDAFGEFPSLGRRKDELRAHLAHVGQGLGHAWVGPAVE